MVSVVPSLPVLESGDRMDREEFHRRYEARPDLHRAELIDGVVYVASPLRYHQHDRQASLCVALLKLYAATREGIESGANASITLGPDDEVQPDAFLFRPASGRLRARADGYLEGAPELVVEVAASTLSKDLHDKKDAYERAGVLEYVVWRVVGGVVDVFGLRDGQFVQQTGVADGVWESEQFPGLRLDIPAMLAG